MSAAYSVRLSPLGPETAWRIEGGELVQQRGRRRTVHPLSALTRFSLLPARAGRPHPSLGLRIGRRRIVIPAAGFGRRGVESKQAQFAAFARILSARAAAVAPTARFVAVTGADRRSALIWAVALLAAGSAGMLLTALSSVVGGLGLSLAAWLAFAALLLAAILPWLRPPQADFDPLAIPEALLSR